MASLNGFKPLGAEELQAAESTRAHIAQLANIDYHAINARLTGLDTLQSWLPEGRKVGNDWTVGSIDGERGQSLRINVDTGKWIDFADGACGSDMVSLYARMHGMSNAEAALDLSDGTPPTRIGSELRASISPMKATRQLLERIWTECPAWKAQHPCIHHKFGQPSKVWTYKDERGRVIGHVARYDPPGEKKQFVPFTWDGTKWNAKAWQSARPLYGLELLAQDTSKPVLVVEGEKAADAGRRLTSDFIVVTWPGGANAVPQVDLEPLRGRAVLLVPDADEPGRKAMAAMRDRLLDVVINCDIRDTSTMPEKWDLADAVADGWDAARFQTWVLAPFAQTDAEPAQAVQPKKPTKKPEKPQVDRLSPEPFPSHLCTIPGVLGQGVQWFLDTAKKPQPVYAVQSMLALGSVVLGRKYRTTHANWSSLYFLVIGRSATGKEYVKTATERVLEDADMHHLIGPGKYASEQGMLSSLIEQPCNVAIQDEFGKVLESAKAEKSAQAKDTLRLMMESWGRCDGTMRATAYGNAGMTQAQKDGLKNRYIIKPALTFVGMSTNEVFYDAIGSGAIRDGFLNRFLVAECHAERSTSRFPEDLPPPSELVQWCIDQRAVVVTGGNLEGVEMATKAPTPMMVGFSSAAKKVFASFDQECVTRMNELEKSGMAEMFGRTNEIAMRLSLIVARSCGASEIGQEHALWATDYARHCANEAVKAAGSATYEGEFDAAAKDVERLVFRAEEHGITERELRKNSRKFARLSPRSQKDILALLAQDGVIELVSINMGMLHPNRKRLAWVFRSLGE